MTRRLPDIGTKLYGRKHRGKVTEATVVQDETCPGKRAIDVAGTKYASPSAAAKAISGHETNGWLWWKRSNGRSIGKAKRR